MPCVFHSCYTDCQGLDFFQVPRPAIIKNNMFAVVYIEFACSESHEIFTKCDQCGKGANEIFGDGVGSGVGSPPPKNFFSQFSFFATYDRKIAFWGPQKILGSGAPPMPPSRIFLFFRALGPQMKLPLPNFWRSPRTRTRTVSRFVG